jgi:hypothetical protein
VSWGVNLEDLAAARDALQAEVAEHPRSHPLERLAHAHHWLGEEDAARRRYREAADDVENALYRWAREDAYAIARIGSLLRRAGDHDAALQWFERAARAETQPDALARLAYLRGDDGAAIELASRAIAEEEARYPLMEALATLATARRDRDAERATAALDRFATMLREDKTPPDEASGSSDLPLWGWLEEAFRVQADAGGTEPPGPRELLDRAGLLSERRAPARPAPAPDAPPQGHGTRTIDDYPAPGGDGTIAPSVTIDEHGDLHFVLHPGRDMRASLVQDGGRWRARIGDTWVAGDYSGPRSAMRAASRPLRDLPDGQWAGGVLGALYRAAFEL